MSEPEPKPDAPANAQQSVLSKEVHQAWRSFRNLGSSLVSTWTIALLVRFLLPRHLGPALYGELVFADVAAGAVLLLATLGVDTYTSREIAVRPDHAADYFAGVFVVRGIISTVALLGLLSVLGWQGRSTTLLVTTALFWMYSATMAFNATIATMLRAVGYTGRLAIANVVAKLAWGIGIAIAVWLPGPVAPLWVFALPALAGELVRVAMTFPYASRRLSLTPRIDVAATRAVIAASFPFFLSALSYNLGGPLNFAVLDQAASDKRELGWFGAMMSLASLGMMFTPLLDWVLLPLLARARARSTAEVGTIIGFAVEGFALCVLPITLLGVLGAPYWVGLAFGDSYQPAALAFQIVIVTIVVTYTAMILSQGLVASGFTWAISSLSLVTLALAPTLSYVLVPLMGTALGSGGQAAGAALANGLPELLVVGISLYKLDERARSQRLRGVIMRALAVCGCVVAADYALHGLGYARLIIDAALYFALLLVTGAVKVSEVRSTIAIIRTAKGKPA